MSDSTNQVVENAIAAFEQGYTPLPLIAGEKRPGVPAWGKLRFTDVDDVRTRFTQWVSEGKTNLGLLLGEASDNLVDVDLDHPKAQRLSEYFLPPTPMSSGRDGRRLTHFWYICEDGTLPLTRQHKMYDGAVSVELRSTKAQTVIPPSVHPSGEHYRWDGEPWGGDVGPAVIDGRQLAAQVALLGLGAALLEAWPQQGSRHEAYLALAGALLSDGDLGVHPFWERNASPLIRALAAASLDDDGPDQREREVLGSTMAAIRAGKHVVGFGKLGEILGEDHVRQIRILVDEVESAAGYVPRQSPSGLAGAPAAPSVSTEHHVPDIPNDGEYLDKVDASEAAAVQDDDQRDPLEERQSSWEAVDLDPYLDGTVRSVQPSMLLRSDGAALMYQGRVNMLYGSSESAKSWVALKMSLQALQAGQRVVYLDFEDEPINTIDRLRRLGANNDDLRKGFFYVHPEDPLADMQRDRWGKDAQTDKGRAHESAFERMLQDTDPALIVADGMTVLYGLHGLNTNDSVQTDVITTWLKRLTRNGRATVVVIDHAGKGAQKGDLPIGSQHKVSMVQGTLLQAWPLRQPMPGEIGEIELVVLKDRPGQVRAVSQKSTGGKAQVAAIVRMDSQTDPQVTDMTITPPPSVVKKDANGVQTVGVNNMDEPSAEQRKRIEARQLVEQILDYFDEQAERGVLELTMGELKDQFPDNPSMLQSVVRTMAGVVTKADADKAYLVGIDMWLSMTGDTTRGRKYRRAVFTEKPENTTEITLKIDGVSTGQMGDDLIRHSSTLPKLPMLMNDPFSDLDNDPGNPPTAQ